MSLAKSSYLGIGLMMGAFFIFRFKARNILTSIGGIFKFSNMVILIIILIGINYFLSRYGDVFNLLLGYWDIFENRIMDVVFTSTGVKLTEEADVDYSAMGRVGGFGVFIKTFFSWNVFLGMGYKYDYLDVPILESFVNHGILRFPVFRFFQHFSCHLCHKGSETPFQSAQYFSCLFVYIHVGTAGYRGQALRYCILVSICGNDPFFGYQISRQPES